jgi:transcriptional regulator with XRE-family HTH domain
MKPKPEKKNLNIQIGESIKAVREQMGLTQERFAELVNVTAQYISDVERGVVGISIATLKRIREVTAISSDSILIGKCDYNDVTLIVEQLRNVDARYINPLKVIINKYLEAVAMSNQNEHLPE